MKCSNCGTELGENDVFCTKCGIAIQKKGGYNTQRTNVQNYGQQYENNGGNLSVIQKCSIIVITLVTLRVLYSIINNSNKFEIGNNPTSITTSSANQTTYKVNYGGFKLYIPDDLIYQMDATNEAINISDALSTWVAGMSIQELPFQQLKQNKSYLSSYFSEVLSSYNATVSNATVENIEEIEFIIMELKVAGMNELIGLAQLNSMYTACFEVVNENNDFDRNVLKNLTSIIRTAEFSGDSKNLEVKGNIKTTDINKALTKAAEEKASDNNQ